MKKFCALAAAALLAASAALAADAPTPAPKTTKPTKKSPTVVFVDVRRILQESTLFQHLQANLKAADEAASAATKPKFQELNERRMAYMAQESKMTPEEKEKHGRELQALQQEAGDMQQRLKADFQKKQEEANGIIQQAFEEVLGALGKESGWDAVVSKSPDVTLWTSDAVDQTEVVLDRLNARPLPNSPLVAPVPAAPAAPQPVLAPAAPAPAGK